MPMKSLGLLAVAVLLAGPWARGADLAEANALREQGLNALKESQTNPDAIIAAAKALTGASDAYTTLGRDAEAQEVNSYLFWCKRRMTMSQIDAFMTGDGRSAEQVVRKITQVAETKVDAQEGERFYERAEEFARKNPGEKLLIAIRFYEVADRFKGSEVSLKAQDRSLKAMQEFALEQPRIAVRPPRPAEPKIEEPPKPAEPKVVARPKPPEMVRAPVPPPAAQKEALKAIKEIYSSELAKTLPEERMALSKKFLKQGLETRDDAAARYMLFLEARRLALQAGSCALALQACEALDQHFQVDAAELKIEVLENTARYAKGNDDYKARAELAVGLLYQCLDSGNYPTAAKCAPVVDESVRKTRDVELIVRGMMGAREAREVSGEFARLKPVLAVFAEKPDDPDACASVGRFRCFFSGAWDQGLPLLARGSAAALKALAEKELAAPKDGEAQAELGEGWWEASLQEVGWAREQVAAHAIHWCSRAYGQLSGLAKSKLRKRFQEYVRDRQRALSLIQGASAVYYRGKNFDEDDALCCRMEQKLQFDWGGQSPDPVVPRDDFGARWVAFLSVIEPGKYELGCDKNGAARIVVEDNPVVEAWANGGGGKVRGGVELDAGVHLMKVEYYNADGPAAFSLLWTPPSQAEETVPPQAIGFDPRFAPATGAITANVKAGPRPSTSSSPPVDQPKIDPPPTPPAPVIYVPAIRPWLRHFGGGRRHK
jgi:hypothetical protein